MPWCTHSTQEDFHPPRKFTFAFSQSVPCPPGQLLFRFNLIAYLEVFSPAVTYAGPVVVCASCLWYVLSCIWTVVCGWACVYCQLVLSEAVDKGKSKWTVRDIAFCSFGDANKVSVLLVEIEKQFLKLK